MQKDRIQFILLYSILLFQGMAFVLIPSISLALIKPGEFQLSHIVYSLLFIPFGLGALILLSLSTGSGNLKQYLGVGLFAGAFGGLLLSLSFMGSNNFPANLIVLNIASLLLGVSFGANLPALYRLLDSSKFFWIIFSLGMALSGFLAAYFQQVDLVWLAPMTLFVAFLLMYNFAIFLPVLNYEEELKKEWMTIWQMPWTFWLFFFIVMIYGFCEASVGYWLAYYLHQVKKLSSGSSLIALGLFWSSISVGRAAIEFFSKWISFKWFYALLPLFIFWFLGLLPELFSESDFFKMSLFLGLAFSAFLPLNVKFAEKGIVYSIWILGGLLSAYIVGYGLGSAGLGQMLHLNKIPLEALYPFASLPTSLLTLFAWITLYFYKGFATK